MCVQFKFTYEPDIAIVGTRVVANVEHITEGGEPPDPLATYPKASYIHAVKGDLGTVIHVHERDGVATVRFDRTGTATIVFPVEVVKVEA